jgi:hypothetical protein
MGRYPRFIPENRDGVLVELTARTIGARALLTPSPNPFRFNELIVGVLGRALEVSPVELCGCAFLGTHFHLLVGVHEQRDLSRFMQHFMCNTSKEVGRLHGWSGSLWARRFDGIRVSDEPDEQWDRLRYLLSNSAKEFLVRNPLEWPGVHSAEATISGKPLEGFWFNRSLEWQARNQGKDYGVYDFATKYEVGIAPLPAFRHLPIEEYRERVRELVGEIEEECRIARDDSDVLGVAKILSQNPHECPTGKVKRSTKPPFHARDPEIRKGMKTEFGEFFATYSEASEGLRKLCGRPATELGFPLGCYPPALPFVGGPQRPCPPAPPTREIEVVGKRIVWRGPVPVVVVPTRIWGVPAAAGSFARGDPF